MSMILLSNSPLTFPACAAAQVGVDFLDGEKWVRSTSISTLGIWIFDSLFDPVEQSWSNSNIALVGISIGDAANVSVDTKYLLYDNYCPFR